MRERSNRATHRLDDSEQGLRAMMLRVQSEGHVDRSVHELNNALSVINMYRELVKDPTSHQIELFDDIDKALIYAAEVLHRVGVTAGSS